MTELERKLANQNKIYDPKSWDDLYGKLVAKEIRKMYSQDKIEAIVNNYLDDPTNIKYMQEFSDLQNYRKSCKLKVKAEMEGGYGY